MGATMWYARDTEILGENEPADYLYKAPPPSKCRPRGGSCCATVLR
jgi:hypothetical protein